MILKDVEEELNVRPDTLELALIKSVDLIHSIGLNLNLEPELKRLTRRYSSYNAISDELFKFLKHQKETVSDFVSTADIQKDNQFNKKYFAKFISLKKLDSRRGISDFLGFNIFLQKNKKYIQKRKVKSFIRSFTLWLLSNHSDSSAWLYNEFTEFKDSFYTLEEVVLGNSKKGRVLGFSKFGDGQVKAIVLLYSGNFIFLDSLTRSLNSDISFEKLDSDKLPINFSFDVASIGNRDNRKLFNILVKVLNNVGVKFNWSGSRVIVETNLRILDLEKVGVSEEMPKSKINLLRKTFGSYDLFEVKDFIHQYLLKPAFCFERKGKIYFSTTVKKLTLWVEPEFKKKFGKLGISAGISSSIIFEQMLSVYENASVDYFGDFDFIDALNELYVNWQDNINDAFAEWKRILNTKNSDETIEKITGILNGRIK